MKNLKVQQYLQKNTLSDLEREYGINLTYSPINEPLVILNYDQISSPKYSEVTRECRGLVLDTTDWSVVARPFSRFFNYGESREEINKFNWNSFTVQEKHDGSLIIVYKYRGTWRVNTRASFGLGKVGDSQFTWEELFYQTIDEKGLDELSEDCTLVFELCSIYNKVVRTYPDATSYLLTIVNRKTGDEVPRHQQEGLPLVSQILECSLPSLHTFSSVDDILVWLDRSGLEPTFEGFVIQDDKNQRIKIKNKNYLRLHRMRGNGDNLFAPKNLVPFILQSETAELLAIYPEVLNHVLAYENLLIEHLLEIERVYSLIWNRNTQKSYALKVMELCPRWSAILFQCRKEQKSIVDVWRKSEDYILKVLDSELRERYTKTLPTKLEVSNV